MKKYILLLVMLIGCLTSPALAGDKLNSSLTALGAEKAGNADSTIPAWTGGITVTPPTYQKGGFHPDPFADDKVLFTITAANWQQYKDKLSAGYQMMFQKYPNFRMPIYPTRRSASYPAFVYEAAEKNAGQVVLTNDGNGVQGGSIAVPFPVPVSGLEAIWNHMLRFRGQTLVRHTDEVVVTSGDYHIFTAIESLLFPVSFPGATFNDKENINVYYKQDVVAPPRLAGTLLLVDETLDKVKSLRRSWLYNPGLRRVSRAPFVSYDSIPPSSDGLRTFDQYDMFNGATDRYDWVLQGKQEMYVPYNVYRFANAKVNLKDIVGVNFLNPDYTRYELHRVWKVQATLKSGKNHLYAKRVFYIDEDSWQILAVEQYDGRGDLWRFSEGHVINFYEVPLILPCVEVHYDFKSNQYLIMQLPVEPYNFSAALKADEFTPATLRQEGNR